MSAERSGPVPSSPTPQDADMVTDEQEADRHREETNGGEAMSLSSDGSDYVPDEDIDDEDLVYDDLSIVSSNYDPASHLSEVEKLLREAALSGNWIKFISHVEAHPEDGKVWCNALVDLGLDTGTLEHRAGDCPRSLVLAFLTMVGSDITTETVQDPLRAIIKVCPTEMVVVEPSPMSIAITRVADGTLPTIALPIILAANPGLARARCIPEWQDIGEPSPPVHLLCASFRNRIWAYGGRDDRIKRAKHCKDAIETFRVLVNEYPQSLAVETLTGSGRTEVPIQAFEWGEDNWVDESSGVDELPPFPQLGVRNSLVESYIFLLQHTARELAGLPVGASDEQVQKTMLFTALRLHSSKYRDSWSYPMYHLFCLLSQMPQLARYKNEKGQCALHVAMYSLIFKIGRSQSTGVMYDNSRTSILATTKFCNLLIDCHPVATRSLCHKGRLPLHDAILAGGPDECYRNIFRSLLSVEPRATTVREPASKLFPFMLAAVEERCSINSVYELLRHDPSVIPGMSREG